jgi:hypothetical protein
MYVREAKENLGIAYVGVLWIVNSTGRSLYAKLESKELLCPALCQLIVAFLIFVYGNHKIRPDCALPLRILHYNVSTLSTYDESHPPNLRLNLFKLRARFVVL